jgi:DNA-binding beta-propeller fold protein YncE
MPSASAGPPSVLGRGTIALVVRDPASNEKRVLVFPPNSDSYREIVVGGSKRNPNSLAFDTRQHLYIGINDTGANRYEIQEIDLPKFSLHRDIHVTPSWPHSSVAVDPNDVLYVNTKAFVGGNIKMFKRGEREPSLEIKEPLSPLATRVANNALWIGNEGFPSNVLTRYRLYSKDRTWFQTIGGTDVISLEVNPDSSLVAPLVRRNGKTAVDVIDVGSGKRLRTLVEKNLQAMTTDQSGNLYVAQLSPVDDKIYKCTFTYCAHPFGMNFRPQALAVSPLDGYLYVATIGKDAVEIFDPNTFALIRTIWLAGKQPSAIAIEP